jgi:hypothetical protein
MADALRRLSILMGSLKEVSAEEDDTKETIDVSVPASTAAALYERVRNTLEYQEDHLIRRNAIIRILRRIMGDDGTAQARATKVLHELVWAKYLPNRSIPLDTSERLAPLFAKFETVLESVRTLPDNREQAFDFVLDVMGTELEHILADHRAEEAAAAFMYEETKKRTEWDAAFTLSEEERDIRLFIAVYRTLLKADPATLRWRVFRLYYPTWSDIEPTDPLVANVAAHIGLIVRTADERIEDPLTDRLSRLVRRSAGVFRVVGDVVSHGAPKAEDRKAAVARATTARMTEFRTRLGRSVTRSILFLLVTKSLTALILEVPYDLLAIGSLPVIPLAINILFHPLFLATIALTIRIPAEENIKDYQEAIEALSAGDDHPILHLRIKKTTRSKGALFFNALYAALFLIVYVAIAILLTKIGFHAMSTGLFLFFFSVMGFFGIRLRMSTRDIIANDIRVGVLGTIIDVLMLPIVRAGSWLSEKIGKLNIFVYFFDFIIEAPLKVAIEFVEGWLRFVREKKEEI